MLRIECERLPKHLGSNISYVHRFGDFKSAERLIKQTR